MPESNQRKACTAAKTDNHERCVRDLASWKLLQCTQNNWCFQA